MRKLAGFIFSIILCLGVAFGLSYYSNGFESFSPVYVVYGGNVVKYTVTMPTDGEFEVKGAGFSAATEIVYTVEIVPNTTNDFSYTVGNNLYSLSDTDYFTDCFTISEDGNTFKISATTVADVLYSQHGGNAVMPTLSGKKSYFNVVVTTDGNKTVTFGIILPIGETDSITDDSNSSDNTSSSDGANSDTSTDSTGTDTDTSTDSTGTDTGSSSYKFPRNIGRQTTEEKAAIIAAIENNDYETFRKYMPSNWTEEQKLAEFNYCRGVDTSDTDTDSITDDSSSSNSGSSTSTDTSTAEELTTAATVFITNLKYLASSCYGQALVKQMSSSESDYLNLTTAEKSFAAVVKAKQAFDILQKHYVDGAISSTYRSQALLILDEIQLG